MSNYLLKEVSEISYFPSDNHVRPKNAHFLKNTQLSTCLDSESIPLIP